MSKRISLLIVVVVVIVGVTLPILHSGRHKPTTLPASMPTTTAVAVTQPARKPRVAATAPVMPTYYQVVSKIVPAVATTQALVMPAELEDSAHLIFHDPVYLDPSGHLWITRPEGFTLQQALVKPADTTEHIVTAQPLFVHWWLSDAGIWTAAAVVREKTGLVLVTKTDRQPLPTDRHFRWESGFSFGGKMVVPTDTGISVFDIEPKLIEHYHALPGVTRDGNPPTAILDTKGILAWAPWERGKVGGSGVSRFVDGVWTDLPADSWPKKPIQLSLLLDGSVLCMSVDTSPPEDGEQPKQPDTVSLTVGLLEAPQVDRKKIEDLVEKLSDLDPAQRQAAFDALSAYGPSIASILEKNLDQQLPEAQIRIHQLLRNKVTPTPGGLHAIDNRLAVVHRYPDGSLLMAAPVGMEFQNASDERETIDPAWILQRPDGRPDRVLPGGLVHDQDATKCILQYARDEWVISDETGTKRFAGGDFEPLLPPSEKQFDTLVGISSHRRWVFKSSKNMAGDTLIVDPTVADPTPKLPVWTIKFTDGTFGWDEKNYPTVDRGEVGGLWQLAESSWVSMKRPESPKSLDDATTEPTTNPTTNPATKPATKPTTIPATKPTPPPVSTSTSLPATVPTTGPVVLLVDHGTTYTDGKDSLTVKKGNGPEIRWPLPATAIGTGDPILVVTADGTLFLFNQPGRLLRIRPTPNDAEPFKLDATFTTDIPNDDHPRRLWLDPADRIDWIDEAGTLHVMFPTGRIPRDISEMMVKETAP